MNLLNMTNNQKDIGRFVNSIIQGDALAVLKTLPEESVDTIITSPPYW